MWNNKVLKQKAKERMKVNYWKMVLVGLLLALLSGGTASESGARNSVQNTTSDITNESQYYDDYDEDAFFSGGYDIDPDMMVDSLGFWGLFGGMMLGVVVVAVVIGICLVIFVFNPLEIGARRFFYRNINEKAELKEVGFGFDRNYMGSVKTMFLRDLYTVLWTLLFIIPGIVKRYEYRMIPYLLAENPEMSTDEAFAISKRMMYGNKLNAFWFDLTFIGWEILGAITFGIVNLFWVNPYYNQSAAMLYDAIKIDDYNRQSTNWQADNESNTTF